MIHQSYRRIDGQTDGRTSCDMVYSYGESFNLSVFEEEAFACALRNCLMPAIDLTAEA